MMKTFLLILITIFVFTSTCYADIDLDSEELESFSFSEVSNNSISEPTTNSKNIIVIDRKTLSVLYEKNGYDKVAMASTTKIMTCILTLEYCSLKEIVTISNTAASIHGSTLGLKKDMKMTINDLLYGLMLRSGNDCAIALAEHISGSVENFSTLMNAKAFELGLFNTNFITPHGLDDTNHYTTAYDLALLTDYALQNSTFKQIVSSKNYTISFNGYPKTLSNTNELLGNLDGVYGVKTGFTFDAGRCLVSAASRNNFDIIVVVLGANTKKIRTQDSTTLINYIFNNYKYIDLSSVITDSFDNFINIYKNDNKFNLEKTSTEPILELEKLSNYEFPMLDTTPHLSTKIFIANKFTPNISQNSSIGTIQLYNNDELICKSNIILKNTLIKNSWKYYFNNIIANLFKF